MCVTVKQLILIIMLVYGSGFPSFCIFGTHILNKFVTVHYVAGINNIPMYRLFKCNNIIIEIKLLIFLENKNYKNYYFIRDLYFY